MTVLGHEARQPAPQSINMALMCPATTAADVDLHTELFEAAVRQLH